MFVGIVYRNCNKALIRFSAALLFYRDSTVYLAIPELSAWEWHPFSLSSAPHEPVVTIHVRVAGDWTMALHKLAMKKTQVDMLIEGPYGNFAIDVTSPEHYKGTHRHNGYNMKTKESHGRVVHSFSLAVFLLVSGGIGRKFHGMPIKA